MFTKTLSIILLGLGVISSAVANDISDDVRQRCIVQLESELNASEVKGVANAFSKRAAASLKHVYTNSINGFTINMPCHAAETVFGDSEFVISLEEDAEVSINKKPADKPGGKDKTSEEAPQDVSYGTTRVGGAVDGSGYTAWVIDSGVDLDHPDLVVNESRGYSVIRGGMNDQHGHGTHVAGTIAAIDNTVGSLGVAQGAAVVPIRVLDRRGSGSISGVIAGVDYVAANASAGDCVNMSLGGRASDTLDSAVISAAANSGAYFALSAGNSSDDVNNYSPARANGTNVYTISAIDSNDVRANFSNYGSAIDYAAPGVSIFSLWKNGETNTISGTSMASPHACAVLMMTNGAPSVDGKALNDPDSVDDPIIHMGN